ncbi:YceI family protein [Deinococcus sp. Leaf326]|jgi:polyisoprenoid-binding protein YceI|uniref:YceI family protein n=1 Tax=Deinococcus sp. Leaf326 TaxID=1736338 RepID=UPI0006F221B1|nr:YceI family protein [Deinococcus sp. Leaf326]KQR31802.1 lipid-binding protein [Deinococcus sp. Leaf326]
MKRLTLIGLIALALPVASAAPVTYTVVTGATTLNLMTAESQTSVENFTGRTSKVSGALSYDAATKSGSGTVNVDGASITTGNAMRDTHMKSADWLNFDKTPAVTFKTTSVKLVSGDKYTVNGTLTLNGVTKNVTSTATVKLTPASAATTSAGLKGNVLAVSTSFPVKLSDYGVKNSRIGGQVNDTLTISLKFVASSGG